MQPDTVRTAQARFASLCRHHADDPALIAQAQRDLDVARAAALTAEAARLLAGDGAR